MKYLLVILLFSKFIYSQNENFYAPKDLEYIEYQLKEILKNNDYIIFSTDTRYFIFLIKDANKLIYKEFFYEKMENNEIFLNNVAFHKDNDCLNNLFKKEEYSKGLITLESEFYKNREIDFSGATTYFVYKTKEGSKYGEAILTTFIKPVPFDSKLYLYLISRISNNLNSKDSYFDQIKCSE